MSVYRDHLERYLSKLDVNAEYVADVGGGSNPVQGRVRSWKVGRCFILDNETEHPVATTLPFDLHNTLDHLGKSVLGNGFDIVFCLEVFEYIWDPVQAVRNLHAICKKGGRLIVTFPFIYPNHNPVKFDCLRYTRQGAERILTECGFRVDKVIPRPMNHTAHWLNLMEADGYKYRGAQDAETLFDAGYIIEATAV